MDIENIKAIALEATQESIESLAFAEVFSSDTPISLEDCTLQIQMDITSEPVGEFILQVSQNLLKTIAESLFPVGEEVTEAQMTDLALELLNTIGGNFLRKVTPETHSFTLGLPQAIPPTQTTAQDLLHWSFTLEEIPFSLYLEGDIVKHLCE